MAETEMVEITESCGCAFCDLGLDPDNQIDGRPVHSHPARGIGYSFCACEELPAPPSKD